MIIRTCLEEIDTNYFDVMTFTNPQELWDSIVGLYKDELFKNEHLEIDIESSEWSDDIKTYFKIMKCHEETEEEIQLRLLEEDFRARRKKEELEVRSRRQEEEDRKLYEELKAKFDK